MILKKLLYNQTTLQHVSVTAIIIIIIIIRKRSLHDTKHSFIKSRLSHYAPAGTVQTLGSIYQCNTDVPVQLSQQCGSHFGSSWHYDKHLIIL